MIRTVLATVVAAALCCGAHATAIPKPTKPQLAWAEHEIMALVHFNMATFVRDGDPACQPDNWGQSQYPSHFDPTMLDTDNWAESMLALGAKHAVLTAKHGCGFLLWPSKSTLPNGEVYPYAVGSSNATIKVDVLKMFSDSMQKAGLGHGFYYSLTNNYFLNVLHHEVQNTTVLPGQYKVTQAQFESIALAQVTELWSNYGPLTEIWFDGGYTSNMKQELTQILKEKQPDACCFDGYGVTSNPTRWIGTEWGDPAYPIWSTGTGFGGGDPNSTVWNPAACDTCLQILDHWFYVPGMPIHDLADLINVYHDTVGQNGLLELDFAIDRTGRVHPEHAARYAEFGDWIRSCYGTPVATTSTTETTATLTLNGTVSVDRIMIREDQSYGQLVRAYQVEYTVAGSSEWKAFVPAGSSIGNKRLQVAPAPLTPTAVRLTITDAIAPPHIPVFAVFAPCPSSS